MMLKNKVAVIYGAGGAIGGAVARRFASEGATLFLTGHELASVETVAKDIVSAGGNADAAEVDALNEQAVDSHLESVINKAGRVDVSFNAVGITDTNILGVPFVELDVEQFSRPITTYTRSYFLTARLAARRMMLNKSGVIHAPLQDGLPFGGRLRCGAGRERGTHSRSIRRTRASGHSRGRPAAPGDAGICRIKETLLRISRQ
jgi:NAD(P)-dependent dehydrogenase (short-subunit alcohol dehydrogenase family)